MMGCFNHLISIKTPLTFFQNNSVVFYLNVSLSSKFASQIIKYFSKQYLLEKLFLEKNLLLILF